MPNFLDVNVLVALADSTHRHHLVARAWLDSIEEVGGIVLCRVSQLALLRLLNNATVMGSHVRVGGEVWNVWDELMADDRFRFAEEPFGLEDELRKFTKDFGTNPKLWQDAYLASFAKAADYRLVTFDAGFQRYDELNLLVLS